MSAVIVLDTSPLGILAHPRNPPHVVACRSWLGSLSAAGRRIVLPEIADYEVRRELIRNQSHQALFNLDKLAAKLEYLPIDTAAMRLAASLWTGARAAGKQTAANHALDGDVILAAQALQLNIPVVVATSNPAHLARFVPAELWSNIKP